MKITRIILNNFKAFQGEHIINIDNPLVCLVGENNTGKTTLFAAIDFLKNGVAREKSIQDYKNKKNQDKDVSVEIIIQGNLKETIEFFSEKKFLPYVYENNGVETIRLKRSSERVDITQSKKTVQLDERKLAVFNQESDQFENPTGFDKAIGSLFETQFVWSDMRADEVVDFGSTKMLGKLLKEVADEFKSSPEWNAFREAHQIAFVTSDNALSKKSNLIVQDIQKSLADFYGNASLKLDFQSPDPDSFLKLGDIHVDDGVTTSIEEKGSGMQRALALGQFEKSTC
jgi:predicted ATP-binding protein involved in virulence